MIRTKRPSSLKRTKFDNPIKIKLLKPKTRFIIKSINMHGKLLYVNDCRAHVQVEPIKIKTEDKGDTEFFRSKFLDISPDTNVYKEK